jgi:hypothetical protein
MAHTRSYYSCPMILNRVPAVLLLSLTICLAASLSACRPSPGMRELLLSRDAVRAAKSWQADTSGQLPSGQFFIVMLIRVECPNRLDRVGLLHDQANRSVHEIWFDGTYYNKDNAVRTWSSFPASDTPFQNCGKGPSLVWDGFLYDDLDAVQRVGEIRRGKTETADDVSCVWWEVASEKGAKPHYSVCVGEEDHLPRIVRSYEHNTNYVYTLSHWDSTSVILPPDIILR